MGLLCICCLARYRNVLRDVAATKIQSAFRGGQVRARLEVDHVDHEETQSGTSPHDKDDVDDLVESSAPRQNILDDVGPDGRRHRRRKQTPGAATNEAESKGESWDVLHEVKGMKKTKTGRYVASNEEDDVEAEAEAEAAAKAEVDAEAAPADADQAGSQVDVDGAGGDSGEAAAPGGHGSNDAVI